MKLLHYENANKRHLQSKQPQKRFLSDLTTDFHSFKSQSFVLLFSMC